MRLPLGPKLQNVVSKVALLVVLPLLIWLGLDIALPVGNLLTIEDAVLFFVCFYSLSQYASKTGEVLRSDGPLDTVAWLTVALNYFCISFILAVVWSVRWRATGHAPVFGEDDLRGAFRFAAIVGSVALVLAQGEYVVRVSPRRWATIAALIIAALTVVGLSLYAEKLRGRYYDDRPGDAHDLSSPSSERRSGAGDEER